MLRSDQDLLRRLVLQRLQSLGHAGVLDLPSVSRSSRLAAETTSLTSDSDRTSPSSVAPLPSGTKEETVPRKQSLRQVKSTADESADVLPLPTLSRDQRAAALDRVCGEVATCRLCEELVGTRTQTVFGVGDPMARLVFLGEAPGADEDRQGEPFVGRAGQLLTKIIEACSLRREQVYILNILKCRPPGNRNPLPHEAANCRDFLLRQLRIIQPEFLCCLGAVAAQNLLETGTPIGQLRGKIHRFESMKVVATYHPAYLLRNPAAKRATWDDMKMLMREMGIEIAER